MQRKELMEIDIQKNSDNKGTIKNAFLSIFIGFLLFAVAFYFLSGDQLRYRTSRGNINSVEPTKGSVELSKGEVIEQVFYANIDRIERINVQFGTYYRSNKGLLLMELCSSDGTVLLHQNFDVSAVSEGDTLEMVAVEPIEHYWSDPLSLRITSDSKSGEAITPLTGTSNSDKFHLKLNGSLTEGVLCFSVSGEDYIWTGQHYWDFVIVFEIGLGIILFIIWKRFNAGKTSFLTSPILAFKKYRFLIRQLVARDFKTRYKRSVLGMLWSFLNPLLTMLVQYFVFSTLFKSNIPFFAAYLIIGVVMFNFFSESCGQTLISIIGNSSLITKVFVPKYIYPITRTMMSVINLGISLVPMLIVSVLTGVQLHKSCILSLFFMLCLVVFSLGLGMLLATSMVFFRDTQFLWGILSMVWMYATPVFYPETILPDNVRSVLRLNPLYHFIKNARICILDGISPEPMEYFRCFILALIMLIVGSCIFKRYQNKFILYL